mgnify:CR=1 FL=1
MVFDVLDQPSEEASEASAQSGDGCSDLGSSDNHSNANPAANEPLQIPVTSDHIYSNSSFIVFSQSYV